jgi:hypothetical protein
MEDYYEFEHLGISPTTTIISTDKIVLYSTHVKKPCIDPFGDTKAVDLSNPSDIPLVDGERCWESLDEIIIYSFEEYITYFIRVPYHLEKRNYLWNPETIPVASDGKIKNWQLEAVGPCYSNVDSNN